MFLPVAAGEGLHSAAIATTTSARPQIYYSDGIGSRISGVRKSSAGVSDIRYRNLCLTLSDAGP